MRYQWQVANVNYPQFEADCLIAAHETARIGGKLGLQAEGGMASSLQAFQSGMFVFPLLLNKPGESVAVTSGYDSRGQHTPITLEVKNITLPTAGNGLLATISGMVIIESTKQLVVNSARQISVRH